MVEAASIFWSAHATAQFLELDSAGKERVDSCVDLISQFPFIGIRLVLARSAASRRFVCAGFQVIYDLSEKKVEANQDSAKMNQSKGSMEITIRFVKRS